MINGSVSSTLQIFMFPQPATVFEADELCNQNYVLFVKKNNYLRQPTQPALEVGARRVGSAERMGLLVNSIPDRSLFTTNERYGPLLIFPASVFLAPSAFLGEGSTEGWGVPSHSGAKPPSEQFRKAWRFSPQVCLGHGYFLTPKSIRRKEN